MDHLVSPKPLYALIRDYILLNIQSGAFPPDFKIPSEREMSEQFNVSRMTVTKAIQELVREGLLYSRVGKGTFVRPRTIDQQLDTLTSFTEEMAQRGQQPSSRVLQAVVQAASEEIARYLRLPPGAEVALLQRVRMADQKPVALETCILVAALVPRIFDKHDFSHESLYAVLRTEYGLGMAYAEQTMEARHSTPDESQVLDLEMDSPILNITRVTYSDFNLPIEYVRSAYRGDRYKFHAILRKMD
jgi:GntR family transcriptional regulator